MGITNINRDWGTDPSIVRIVTTDSQAVAGAPGYLTAQAANIALTNHGPFQWALDDSVLVAGSDGNKFYFVNSTFTGLLSNVQTSANGITAHAGGGQALATLLTAEINRVTVVATAGDSVLLPVSQAGRNITIINATATSMNVFPQVGDVINALAANAAFAMAAGKTATFYCAVAGFWYAVLSA